MATEPDPHRPEPRARSSREAYRRFIADYRAGRLDAVADAAEGRVSAGDERKGRGLLRGSRRGYLRRYLGWLHPHRLAVGGVFGLALVVAGIEMVEPLFARHIIDRVLLDPALDAPSRLVRLHVTGAIFVAVVLLSNLAGAMKDYRQRLLNTRVILSLRKALYGRLLHLPLPRLWEMKTGGVLSRLTGDVETTTGLLQMAVMTPSLSIIRLVIALGVLLGLNWRLALTAMAVLPGAMVLSLVFARRVRPIYRAVRKDVEHLDARVAEAFSGLRVVRAFRRELRELLDYMAGRHSVLRKELFAHRRELVLWTSWGLLQAGVNVVILWYGGYMNILGQASIGDIMAFQWYTFMLMGPVWSIVNSFSELQRSLAAMERVFEVLEMEEEMPDRPGARAAPSIVRELRFEGVEFAYREGQPVVSAFDVTVKGGSVIALVGRSGAGKSTVTDLVARFHDPTAGRILLNGTDLRDLKLRTYRSLLAIVQQDVFLFDGSVRENIAYGRRDAAHGEIEAAALRANAHEFIARLPHGYDTIIGERGVKLSGGQRQRLAIARAILASPQILILDEATSNLDTESEQLIQGALADLLKDRTTFVIAHRLSTVRRADQILLMAEGRIVERGTHEELMRAGGVYHEMVIRQMEKEAHPGIAPGW